jgi:hypothetical protein
VVRARWEHRVPTPSSRANPFIGARLDPFCCEPRIDPVEVAVRVGRPGINTIEEEAFGLPAERKMKRGWWGCEREFVKIVKYVVTCRAVDHHPGVRD